MRRNVPFKPGFVELVCVLASIFFVSCSTHMTTRASGVRLVGPEQAYEMEAQCDFLANVSGKANWFLFSDTAHNNALNEILDQAGELGATHLFVNRANFRMLFGEAYFCANCQNEKGEPITEGCEDKDGNAVPLRDMAECKGDGNTWIGTPRDQARCEEKGGKWVTNKDVLRGEKKK